MLLPNPAPSGSGRSEPAAESHPREAGALQAEWHADPLYQVPIRAFAAQLSALPAFPGVEESFDLYGHAITQARIVGVIVGLRSYHNTARYVVYVDDGSGVMECVLFHEPKDWKAAGGLHFGALVEMRGKLRRHRGAVSLSVAEYLVLEDPNLEPLHWLQVLELHANVYGRPPAHRLPSNVANGGE